MMMYWFLFTLLSMIKCDLFADILLDTKEKLSLEGAQTLAFFVTIGGALLTIIGIRYKTISLTALCAVFITQLISNIMKNIGKGELFGFLPIPKSIQEYFLDLIAAMEGNQIIYWGVILLLSLVVSYLLVSFIHTLTLVVLLILLGISYTGGYHERIFQYFGIENEILKYVLIGLVFCVMFYLYFKIPKIIFVIIFALTGSAMVTYGIDTLFKLKWNSLELFTNTIEGKFDTSHTAMFFWMVTFAFGLGAQFLALFTGKS